jgi:hypothetical protein
MAICKLRLELAAIAAATALASGAAAKAAPEDSIEVDCKVVAISNSAMRQLEDENLAGLIYHLSGGSGQTDAPPQRDQGSGPHQRAAR